MNICDFGCGQEATYKLKNGKYCCSKHHQSCPEQKKKNSNGLKRAHAKGKMRGFTLEDVNKSNELAIKNSIKKAFVENSTYSNEFIKPRFIKMLEKYECFECKISKWNGKDITLELDHINGNNRDNRVENLRLLCPNCHSQTDTFRGKGINTGFVKVSDKDLIEAIKTTKNIRQALMKVGLTPKGDNYRRVYKLKEKHFAPLEEWSTHRT